MDIFNRECRVKLMQVEQVLKHDGLGINRRIDENRELMALLKARAPELLNECGRIEEVLRAQDHFLLALKDVTAVSLEQPAPRPWPGSPFGEGRRPLIEMRDTHVRRS